MPIPCRNCGEKSTSGRCKSCYAEQKRGEAEGRRTSCRHCSRKLHRQAKGDECSSCLWDSTGKVRTVLEEEAHIAPPIQARPKEFGDWAILSDPHIPYHHPGVIAKMCRDAEILGVRNLVIPGDLIHADTLSKYLGVGKQVAISDELVACGRVLSVLEMCFDRIIIALGNHDQRVERAVAKWRESVGGQRAIDLVAGLLGVPTDAESVAQGIFAHFFASPKVTVHSLPDIEINGTWLLTHPGSASRIAPQNERKLAEKHRKSVIAGHTHLFGVGFESSGTDIAFNCGFAADETKWRYQRERPTTFPVQVRGYGFLLCDDDSPHGRLLPIADHPKWFDLEILAGRIRR